MLIDLGLRTLSSWKSLRLVFKTSVGNFGSSGQCSTLPFCQSSISSILKRVRCLYFYSPQRYTDLDVVLANRTLEDIDAYYRSNPSLIVVKDPDAISVKRPLKYIEHEDHEMRKIGEIKTRKDNDLMVEHVE